MAADPNVDLFDSYFRRADLDRDGRISGEEAVAFFHGSGLPMNVLAQIWMYADQNKIGFLGRAEFYNALKLVTVAQSKRELTPHLVKAALYGPASAKIPPPQISLAALSAPLPSSVRAPPTIQMNTGAPTPSPNLGSRPHAPTTTNLHPQYLSAQGNQNMRPPQALTGYSSHPSQGVTNQGFSPGGGSVPGAALPNSSGTLAGFTNQVSNIGSGPQDGFETTLSGLTASRPPRPPVLGLMQPDPLPKDSRAPNGSGNGFASDSIFGDVFSATTTQIKQNSSEPTVSAGNFPVSSVIVPVSAGTQPSVNHSPLNSLQSSLPMQPLAAQPAQSFMKQNQQVSIPSNSTHSTTGIPHRSETPVSSHSQIPWQKITQSDVQKYTKVFLEVDKDRDGKITGLEARNLFLSWRLPREILMQVWELSDQDNDSMLSLKEFCIALYLMERYREGRPLPAVLPSNVIIDFPTLSQPTTGYDNASWGGPTPGWQQQQGTSVSGAQQVRSAVGSRPPLPIPIPQADEESETKQPKSKVPILEKELANQLSKEEQEALNSKFREATEADKKVEDLEKEILESKEKIEFYRSKMQELVLYKSRCDNRLNEITERVSGDKREVDLLAKKYEEKCKQLGDVASKLTMEEATFRDVQEKKMELYQAIVKMEQDGTGDGILQERADRVQSDLDELLKTLNDRCKKYGLRAKPTALVELPFGWQPGIQEEAADWDEDWDKFEDEGFTFLKELTLDVQNVIAPPRPKSVLTRKEKVSTVESPTAVSSSNGDVKLEKASSIEERAHENGSPVAARAVESPSREYSEPHFSQTAAATAVESPSREFSKTHYSKPTSDYDASPHAKESESDHGGADSLVSEDKVYDEQPWGTFETNDDIDSVWGFNPASTSKDSDHVSQTNDYFFGSEEFNINPIRTELPGGADGFNQNRSTFFDDSVPSTPLYTSGYSPRYSQGSEHAFGSFSRFDSFSSSTQDTSSFFQPRETFSRFDSMKSNKDFDLGRETFSRFDSMKSTKDFDNGQGFHSFDDSDTFGSSGPPLKTTTWMENETPRRGSDNWSAF